MPKKVKPSPLRNLRKSFLFNIVKDRLAFEPLGLHWVANDKEPTGGHFGVNMPETGVQWRADLTKKYWLYKPLVKLPGIREIHYTFPYFLGIWLHRTILWADGHKTHERLQGRAKYIGNKYDIAEDFIKFRKQQYRKKTLSMYSKQN